MNLTLRWKVTLGILASVGVALALAGWLILRFVLQSSVGVGALPGEQLKSDVLASLGAAFALTAVLSLSIAWRLTRPLVDMTERARQLATGGLDHRIRATSTDEVGQLADVLNQITDQLQVKIHEVSEDRAQLLAMLTAMAEGVMVLDAQGQILQINPALERMFDLHAQPSRGRHFSDLIRHAPCPASLTTCWSTGPARTGKYIFHRAAEHFASRLP